MSLYYSNQTARTILAAIAGYVLGHATSRRPPVEKKRGDKFGTQRRIT
ncbi:MAG: hypothetical protein AB1567_04230 [bacterium]